MRQSFTPHQAADRRSGRGLAWLVSWCGLLLAGFILLSAPAARAQDDVVLDYQVKAADLLNFPKYVDWPAATFPATNSPITVAVFGDDNVANEFGNMVSGGKVIQGHPIVLKRITKEEEIGTDCQILFIADSEKARVPAILEKLKGTGTLTVGESDNFLEQGGIINLVHKGRRIRLQVNLNAARQAQLRISSRLLVVADLVKN